MKDLKKFLSLGAILISSIGFSQITVTNTQTPAELVSDVLVGGGVGVSGIEFNYSVPEASAITGRMGAFDATGTTFEIPAGIILATGNVSIAPGPNGFDNSSAAADDVPDISDPDLNAIAGTSDLHDESVLEFDITVTGDSLIFHYIFASEEYPEFVGSEFNDVFGFFVSGPGISGPYSGGAENIALIPYSSDEVAINNVNNGDTDSGPCMNCEYYVSNAGGPDIEYDGYTVRLKAAVKVECLETYHVKIAIADVGDGAYDSAIFLEENSLNSMGLIVTYNEPTCYGFTDGSITLNIVGGEGGYDFSITDSLGAEQTVGNSNAANNLGSGWYDISVVDTIGCGAVSDLIFLDQPPQIEVDLNIQDVLCHGDATGYVEVDTVLYSQGDYDWISYDWSTGPPGGLGEDSDTLLTAGTYTLDLTDSLGCSASIVFEVEEPPVLEFSEIGYEPAYCRLYGYQVGNGQVFAAATGGTPDYTYQWENLGTAETSTNTTWGGLNPGDYEITVTDGNGCILTQVVTLDSVNPTAILDIQSAQLNGNYEGTAQVCISATNIAEYFANPLNPLADTSFWISIDYPNDPWTLYQDGEFFNTFDTCYNVGGEYDVCLKVQNKNGCEDSTCTKITVWDPLIIKPPNIFTPNGDGVNDIYTFEYLSQGVRTFNCIIVNRWGVTLAEINDINEGWDGTDKNGSICKDGVYFFKYSGEAENGEEFDGQGTIQIIGTKN